MDPSVLKDTYSSDCNNSKIYLLFMRLIVEYLTLNPCISRYHLSVKAMSLISVTKKNVTTLVWCHKLSKEDRKLISLWIFEKRKKKEKKVSFFFHF